MRKPLLCKLGIHKRDELYYERVVRSHSGRKTYHRNYYICERCGKRLGMFARKGRKNGKN